MTTKEHLAVHDKQIAAIRALIQEGMHLMVETRRELRATATLTRQNAEALKRLIDSRRTTTAIQRPSPNGYPQSGYVEDSHKIGLKYPNIPQFFRGIL